MSRQIKFRAWDKYNNKMSDWDELTKREAHKGDLALLLSMAHEQPDLVAVMQLSGLKDCYDEELYEGDVVDEHGTNREIVFKDGAFCTIDERGEITLDSSSWILLGNRFENPELLEGGDALT